MVGFLIFLIVVAATAAVAWLLLARGRNSRTAKPARAMPGRSLAGGRGVQGKVSGEPDPPDVQLAHLRRDPDFWGAMVQFPAGQGCAAAREVSDTKFSLDRVPRLPLRGCDARQCQCRYLGLKERRRKDVLPPDSDDRRSTGSVEWDIHKS